VDPESADFLYKTTDYYMPEHERTIIWSDSSIDIAWPLTGDPLLAVKDKIGIQLADAEVFV
jgi:dTDP-4-dehydrorhamnose 3,5-epimerase